MQQNGIVVLWVSIFLLLFAMLILVSMQALHLGIKSVNQEEIVQKAFYSAEAALREGERQVRNQQISNCRVPQQDINYYPQMNKQWWQAKSNCSIDLNGMMSYYVIEDLGTQPCIVLADDFDWIEDQIPVAHFYRVSAMTQQHMHQLISLQSTVAVTEIMANHCDQQQFQVASAGCQSWRKVN
jgi:hypothetical protein